MGGRLYSVIILIAVAVIGFIVYLTYNKGKKSSGVINFSGSSGVSINITNQSSSGGSRNVNNVSYINSPSYNSSQMLTSITNENITRRSGRYLNEGGNVSISEENTSVTLLKKAGNTLLYSGATDDAREETTSPFARNRGGSGGFSGRERVCTAIINTINTDAGKILDMKKEDQYKFVLNRLRFVPNFGGLSALRQDQIVKQILEELLQNNAISPTYYCNLIGKIPPLTPYEQCLVILDKIITQNVTDPKEILRRLMKIEGFDLIDKADRELIVDMIIKGVKEGNLSKEYICSLIQQLITGGIEGLALYRVCLLVIEELSNVKESLTPEIIESYLLKIPGYSILTKDIKKEIITGILEDKRIDGMLDAEYHCSKIVKYILDALKQSEAYQKCILVMDKIISSKTKDPKKVQEMIETIPGFMVIAEHLRKKLIESVLLAIELNVLAKEKDEICRNIALAIEDAIRNSEIYKQCVLAIENLLNNRAFKDEAYILEYMQLNITGFKLLKEPRQKHYAKLVLDIDVTKPTEKPIRDICYAMTVEITGILQGSELYQQCIKSLEKLDSDPQKKELTLEKIKEILRSSITGFATNLSEKLQLDFASRVLRAIQADRLLDEKEQICIDIVNAIYDSLSGGDLFKKCIKIVDEIFKNPNRKDKAFIKAELSKKLANFSNLSADKQEMLINMIFEAPFITEYFFYSASVCKLYEQWANELNSYTECIKSIMMLIIEERKYDFILGKLQSIPEFKNVPPSKKSNYAKQIELIKIKRNPDGGFVDSDYKSAISKSASMCQFASGENPDGDGSKDPGFENPNENPNALLPEVPKPLPQENDFSRCAMLNKLVYENYVQYATMNNQATPESFHALINDSLYNDFYIPDRYMSNIEEGLVKDLYMYGSDIDPSKLKYSTIIDALYLNLSSDKKTVVKTLTPRARATFVSRLFRERELILHRSVPDDLLEEYLIEMGRCTRPDRDTDEWSISSKRMEKEIFKVSEPIQNSSQNNILSGKKGTRQIIEESKQYNNCISTLKLITRDYLSSGISQANFASSSSISDRILNATVLPGYNKVDKIIQNSIREKIIQGITSCTEEDSEICVNERKSTCYFTAWKVISAIELDPDSKKLSTVSQCGFPVLPPPVVGGENLGKMEFLNLSYDGQKLVAGIGLKLISGFEISAKNRRLDIVRLIWDRTEAEYNSARQNGTRTKPINVSACEAILDSVWGNYSDDGIKQLLEDPLNELFSALDELSQDLESGDGIRDYTTPPSQKCKCYVEQLYKELHAKVIDNFTTCEGANIAGNNKFLSQVQILTNKYLTSKQATLSALPSDATTRGKHFCSMMFESIQDIVQDRHEIQKFARNKENEPILNQICVQQLRDIYSIVTKIKSEYFIAGEDTTYRGANCDKMADN